jgi:hypothetical protein
MYNGGLSRWYEITPLLCCVKAFAFSAKRCYNVQASRDNRVECCHLGPKCWDSVDILATMHTTEQPAGQTDPGGLLLCSEHVRSKLLSEP